MRHEGIRLERAFAAPAERIWELWTTPAGIEAWWGVTVVKLDLRLGGELVYERDGRARLKTFTEIAAPNRLAYDALIDFVPEAAPYEHLTSVEIAPDGRVVLTVDPMHDADWTERLVAARRAALETLATRIGA